MQAEVALRSPSPAGRWPSAVVALRTGRKAARSGALWGYVFGAYVAELSARLRRHLQDAGST